MRPNNRDELSRWADVPNHQLFPAVEVQISSGDEMWIVNLPVRIDGRSCSYQVKNGVLDIICRKS